MLYACLRERESFVRPYKPLLSDGCLSFMIEIRDRFVMFTPPKEAAYLMGDFTDWDERPLPIREPGTIEFRRAAYIEYAFLDTNMQPLADVTNPERPKNPWHDHHRSITLQHTRFQMPPRR